MKWKHFPLYWPYVRGIHRSPVNSPHKGHWRGALMFSLIHPWINGWINNGETHYDVIVMINRIWWLCLVPTLTTRFDGDLGCRMAKNSIGFKGNTFMNNDIKFLNTECETWYSLTSFEDHFGIYTPVIFRPQNVWFPSHLYVGLILNSSGQLAELIVYIIPP